MSSVPCRTKTTLTAAIATVLAKKFGGEAKGYDQIVPTFTWGLVRSNLPFAISISPKSNACVAV